MFYIMQNIHTCFQPFTFLKQLMCLMCCPCGVLILLVLSQHLSFEWPFSYALNFNLICSSLGYTMHEFYGLSIPSIYVQGCDGIIPCSIIFCYFLLWALPWFLDYQSCPIICIFLLPFFSNLPSFLISIIWIIPLKPFFMISYVYLDIISF